MNKLIWFWGVLGFMLFLTSCAPVRIVSAKYNGSDIIPFHCGHMRVIAYVTSKYHYGVWFNYFFSDTVIFRPDIQTIHKDTVISHHSQEMLPQNPDYMEHILFGDSVMEIRSTFYSPRQKTAVPDIFSVHISGFFDKRNNPILLNPIEYYIENEVNYNPFRDGGRPYVSSNKKVKIDFKNGYLIIYDNGQCRSYVYGKPKKKATKPSQCP